MRPLAAVSGLDPEREKRLRAELAYRLGRPPTPSELVARANGRVGPLAQYQAYQAQLQAQLQAQRPSAPSKGAPSKGIWKAAPTSAAAARLPPQPSHVKAAPKPAVFRGAQAQAMRF